MAPLPIVMLMLAAVQPVRSAPPLQVPIVPPERDCSPAEDPDEIVVCGESSEDSPYRVPQQFRNQRSDADRDASWDARIRDQEALERFSNQTDGPFGVYRQSRELDCQWRAARQELRGERPDCGRGLPF
jgi:hypothetical protein